MAKATKIEQRTRDFIAALEALELKGKAPSNADLVKVLGLNSVSSISEIKAQRQNIKPEAWKNFEERYSSEYSENYSTGEREPIYAKMTDDSRSLQALYTLIDANKKLAESHYNFSEANKKLADTNERLTVMLQQQRGEVASVQQQKPEAYEAMLHGVQELLLDVAAGTRYNSRQEAAAALLGKVPHADVRNNGGGDIQKN